MRYLLTLSLMVAMLLGPRPVAAVDDAELRKRVPRAIQQAQRYLAKEQLPNGSWQMGITYPVGATSLAVLALLNSGMTTDDAPVEKGLAYLRSADDPRKVYEASLLIMALALADGGQRDLGRIARLAESLEKSQHADGGWGYEVNVSTGQTDNSNTQFALLGLREAAHAGIPISENVWRRSLNRWIQQQRGSRETRAGAGWDYGRLNNPVTGSMTVAGISSLVIAASMLPDQKLMNSDGTLNCCGNEDDTEAQQAIDAGIRWMGTHFRDDANPGTGSGWLLYYHYGTERAGRLSGRRFFGDHDWYREIAEYLVNTQAPVSGSWNEQDPVVSTTFALLFLSKGLAPVLINKLKFGPTDPQTGDVVDAAWNRHPYDVRNLTDYITGQSGWPKLLTWQVVDLQKAARQEGVAALLQAPVQLMSSADDPDTIDGAQLDLLREYIAQGGFLFAVQNCQSEDFDRGFRDLVRRLFAEEGYELTRLPATHDIYRSENALGADPPELWGVDLGCRTAIVYAPFDHACRWGHWMRHHPPDRPLDLRTDITRSMKLATNVIAYATGRELFDKLNRPDALAEESDQLNRGRLTIARLKHTGGWDTAPHALRHLRSALQESGIDAAGRAPTIPADLEALSQYPVVYMHGRKNFEFSEQEREAIREWLESGGVLFADACCGSPQFDRSFREFISATFESPLKRIPADHELFRSEWGYDIRQVKRRVPPSEKPDAVLDPRPSVGEPYLEGLEINGRYAVVYSKYDISCALERQATVACTGYTTDDAIRIAVNTILYAVLQPWATQPTGP